MRCLAALAVVGLALSAAVLGADVLSAREILDRTEAAATAIEDLRAILTIETFRNGEISLSQTMTVALRQPDKMRQEFLSPAFLAGNVTVIVGDTMLIYIAAADRWETKDLSTLSMAEQPWLLFRNMLRSVRSQFDDYTFARIDDADSGQYHLRGEPMNAAAVYGQIDLWVDAGTFVPVRRILYDTDGRLLADARFLEPTRVGDVATIPLSIGAYDADDVLLNVITYSAVDLNQGLSDALFAVPGASGG
jgi:outer membrane lipoprotein-sorting protein